MEGQAMTIDVEKLIALAEKARDVTGETPTVESAVYWSNGGKIPEGSEPQVCLPQCDEWCRFIAALNPNVALALLRELQLARAVVEAAKKVSYRDWLTTMPKLDNALIKYHAACAKQSEGRV